jgi:hypothetical protein
MPTPSWSSTPSQPGKSQQKTPTSRDPVSGEQIRSQTALLRQGFEGHPASRHPDLSCEARQREAGRKPVPSAPPNPCSIRVWTGSGENSDTTLCHTVPQRPSKKRSPTASSPSQGCSTTASHTPSQRLARPFARSPNVQRRQSSGLIVRGSTYYLRIRVPRPLAPEVASA